MYIYFFFFTCNQYLISFYISVISRGVKLVPEPHSEGNGSIKPIDSSKDRKEFNLEDIFDFIKGGVEVIIVILFI